MPKSKEFVSSSDSESDSDAEPKPKKKKTESKPAKPAAKPGKSDSKKQEKGGGDNKKNTVTSSSGETMFQLSRMRFVTVSEFRGKIMVGIREYYEADGDLRPGKKGISLTMEQWNSLKDQIADIDELIKEKS